MIVFKKGKKTTFFKRRVNKLRLIKYQNYCISTHTIYAVSKSCGFIEPRIYRKIKRVFRKNTKKFKIPSVIKFRNRKKRSLFGKIYNKKYYTLKKKFKRWFLFRPNYIITKKSKNARMGKGKGNYKRWLIKVYRGDLFFKSSGASPLSFSKIFDNVLNKKLKVRFKVFFNQEKGFSDNSSKTGFNFFFRYFRYK